MRKIISMIHLSLDGFASGLNDELNWITYDTDLEHYAYSMHDLTDAVIWGRKTYEGMASYWLTVPDDPEHTDGQMSHVQWLQDATKVVVSRTLDRINWGSATNTVLIKDNIAEEINTLKQQPGKDIWLLGSTNLMQTFMKLDLIDEYRFNINPTMLGKGKRLFTELPEQKPLRLLEARTLKSGVIVTRYEPVRS